MSAVGERNELGLTAWDRYRILTTYRTIAMVGLSTNYYNASSFAAIYLDANGYDIIPVNPVQAGKAEILGKRVYPSLEAAAADHRIDIVDVFRPSSEAPELARSYCKLVAKIRHEAGGLRDSATVGPQARCAARASRFDQAAARHASRTARGLE